MSRLDQRGRAFSICSKNLPLLKKRLFEGEVRPIEASAVDAVVSAKKLLLDNTSTVREGDDFELSSLRSGAEYWRSA